MKKIAICSSGPDSISMIPFAALLVIAFLFLLMSPSSVFAASWESVGPSGGNFVGSVTNPADANQITVITTSPSPSNVYRSTDGGASWTRIGEIPSSYVSDVCAFNFSRLYAVSGSRCFRSTDGGANWTYASFPPIYHICVDSIDRFNKVYAVGRLYNSSDGTDSMSFFKSTNGGQDWTAETFFAFDYFYPYDMAISKSNPSVMYVAGYKGDGWDYYGVLLKSSDGGTSWTDISSSVDARIDTHFYSVAIDPTDPDRVYVGGFYYDFGIYYYIYSSEKAGSNGELTWTRVPMDSYVFSIGIDPVEPSNIYAAGLKTIFTSTNYGRSWVTNYVCFKGEGIHIEVAPATPSTVYLSSLFKSSDSGNTWDFAHEGIHATRVSALAIAPSHPSTVLIEYEGCEMMGSYDSGDNWNYLGYFVICGNVCDILIDPLDENVVLALEGDG